jgi:hypothetical protein
MVYFHTKNPDFGRFWRALKWKILVYFMTFWNILRPFIIIFAVWCMLFVFIGYIFSRFGVFGPRKIWQPWRGALRKDATRIAKMSNYAKKM